MKKLFKILFWVVGVALLAVIVLITYIHDKNNPQEASVVLDDETGTQTQPIVQNPSRVDMLWNQARRYQAGQITTKELEPIYDRIINDYPNNPRLAQAYSERAFYVYGNMHRIDEAIADYKKAVERSTHQTNSPNPCSPICITKYRI